MRYELRNNYSAVKLKNSFQLNPYFYIQLFTFFWITLSNKQTKRVFQFITIS